jgi:ATP-dependent Lon protease
LLSEDNRKDIEEIKEEYLRGLKFHYVRDMNDVIKIALTNITVKNAKKL